MAQTSLNKVSIRLSSGGHSFSTAELNASNSVEVTVLTHKTTLVPSELFDDAHAADYLTEVGLAPSVAERVVASEPMNGTVAVMSISAKVYDELTATGAELLFASPLADDAAVQLGTLLHLEDDVLYVRHYCDGLKFAEAFECRADADVLYYLATVNEVYNIYNMSARARGEVQRLKRVCKGLFKELLCE